MADRISTEESFVDYFIDQRGSKPSFLDKIDKLIDWSPFEKILEAHFHKKTGTFGRPAYPPLPMFKLQLIRRWYRLSDRRLEEALRDRISFIRFSGFSFESSIPAASTIGRFRRMLRGKGLYDHLIAQADQRVREKGLLIRHRQTVEADLDESPNPAK